MNRSMPDFPVHHQLLEFTQIHVHWVGDVTQPSHLLSAPFIPASIFPSIRVFSNESALSIRWPKYWSFSFNISLPVNTQDWFPLGKWLDGLVGSPCSPRDSQESSPTPQFKSINSSALSFLYSPILTSVQTTGKTIALTRQTFVDKVMSLLFNMCYYGW